MYLFLLTLWRHMEACRFQAPLTLTISTISKAVEFTSRPLYPRGKRPLETVNTKLGGSQNWCGRFCRGGEKNRSCWEPIHVCFVVQPVDSSVYRLHSPVSRTYIFVFRRMCLNRNGQCPSPWVTRNKTFWSLQKCRVSRDSTCWTVSKTLVLDHPSCRSGWMNFDKISC